MLTKKEMQILELRKKGMKQEDIASRLRISQPAVSSFERNALKKIREAKQVVEIADSMGIKYDEE